MKNVQERKYFIIRTVL